jgi:cytolysin (calcineurin-like family phosphatase)
MRIDILYHVIVLALAAFLSACKASNKSTSFYVFSDTHCLDSLDRHAVLDSMVGEANSLSLQDFPDTLKHLKKQKPKGLLICGDLTDNAKPGQWAQFTQLFGLLGEGRLRMPVYENYGNHDGDTSGIVRTAIRERNKSRKHLTNISENGLHYSWDWGSYHFISLGSYPSAKWDSACGWCHYFKSTFREPQNSLGFLRGDLKKQVRKNTKVILYFHYGWDSFSQLWWTKQEQQDFFTVIKDYNVAAIFTGHNHATGYTKWNGIDVYSAGSPQGGAKTGSFLYVNAGKDSLHIVERRMGKWGIHSYKKAVL